MTPAFWDHPYVKPVVVAVLIASVFALWKALKETPKRARGKLEVILQDVVFKATEPIRKELMSNDGSSLRDMVKRIEDALVEARKEIELEKIRKWALLGMEDENIAVFETDSTGALTALSPQITQWTGCAMAELQGDRWVRIIARREQEDVSMWWKAVVRRGTAGEMEQTYVGHDRRTFRVRVTAVPLIDPKTGDLMGHTGKIVRLDRI